MFGMAAVVALAFLMYFFAVLRPTGLITINSVFLYMQVFMALGTFPLLDHDIEADMVYGWILVWVTLSYMFVSGGAVLRNPVVWRDTSLPEIRTYQMTITMKLLMVLAIAIMVGYYLSVGSSALIDGLKNSLTGGDADVASQRLAAYAGDSYFFPGYVNQFKNALLPAFVVVLVTEWKRNKQRKYLMTILLSMVAAFGLLGTGQRGAFVIFAIAIVVYLYIFNQRKLPKKVIWFGVLSLGLILVATVALGRESETWSTNAGIVEKLAVALGAFAERIFGIQQAAAVYGFRYIYEQEIQFGLDWANSFLGILPGLTGSDLSNQIFAMRYGSDRGTSPPSIWGSIYHNFGFFGIAIMPALLALLFVQASKNSWIPRQRNTFEVMGIAGATATIGLWAAGSPVYLLNVGLVVYIWMWWWGARVESSHQQRADKLRVRVNPLH